MANHFLYESKTAFSNPSDVIFNNVYLGSINSQDGKTIINPTTLQFLSEINQNLAIGSNPSFNLTNSQSSIVNLANLSSVGIIGNTVIFQGNIQVNGTEIIVNSLNVESPLIGTGNGNLTNTVDLGIYSEYSTDGKTPQYCGLVRDHTKGASGEYVLFNSLSEPTTILGSYSLVPLNVSQLNGNVLGNLTGQVLTATQNSITTLPNISSLSGSTFTNFSTLAGINQQLSTTSSPTFNNLTSNLTGQVLGNLTGQVLTATQNSITSIPNLTTIGSLSGLTLSGNLNMSSNQIINVSTITATTLGGTLSTALQPNITTLNGLTSIQSVPISSTQFGYLGALNQSVSTTSSPTFNNISGTLLTALQPNITTLNGLTSIQSVSISSTQFGYLGALNQSVSTTSSPTFNNISGTLLTTSQTNITSIGTLSSLTVSGNTTINAFLTVKELFCSGDGAGNCFRTYTINDSSNFKSQFILGSLSNLTGGWAFGQGLNSDTVKQLYIYDNNTSATRLICNTNGNFTLGNSDLASSSYRLYVSGNEYINGSSFINGSCSVSSLNISNYSSGTSGNIMAGNSAPTITPDSYSTVSSTSTFKWIRIGNQVSVVGNFTFTVSVAGAGASSFNFSLPQSTFISSTFTSSDDATGLGIVRDNSSATPYGNATVISQSSGNYVLINVLLNTGLSTGVSCLTVIDFKYVVK